MALIKDAEIYYAKGDQIRLSGGGWPVFVRSHENKDADGKVTGYSMGGPVAYCDTREQAEQLAGILNTHERIKEVDFVFADRDRPFMEFIETEVDGVSVNALGTLTREGDTFRARVKVLLP